MRINIAGILLTRSRRHELDTTRCGPLLGEDETICDNLCTVTCTKLAENVQYGTVRRSLGKGRACGD